MKTLLLTISLTFSLIASAQVPQTAPLCKDDKKGMKQSKLKDKDGIAWSSTENKDIAYYDGELYTGLTRVCYAQSKGGYIRQKMNWMNGKRHGLAYGYHKDGWLKWEKNYSDGKLHGKVIYYFADGTKKSEKNYINGVLEGEEIQYFSDETGSRVLTITHADMMIAPSQWDSEVRARRPTAQGKHYIVYTTQGTTGVDCYFVSGVHLPDGATVTNVEAKVYDMSFDYDITMLLYRQANDLIYTDMADVSTNGAPARYTLSDNTIVEPIIDNSSYSYILQFKTKENASDLGIYYARITYALDQED